MGMFFLFFLPYILMPTWTLFRLRQGLWLGVNLTLFLGILPPIGFSSDLFLILPPEDFPLSLVTMASFWVSAWVLACFRYEVLVFLLIKYSHLRPWHSKASIMINFIRPWLVTQVYGCTTIFTTTTICVGFSNKKYRRLTDFLCKKWFNNGKW